MLDTAVALQTFFSGFGLPAFPENAVPDTLYDADAGAEVPVEPPYITYELREPVGEFQQNTQEKSRTESEKKDDDSGAAENNAQNPLLSLVDKPQFFSFPIFHSNVPFREKQYSVLFSEVYHNRPALPNLRRERCNDVFRSSHFTGNAVNV